MTKTRTATHTTITCDHTDSTRQFSIRMHGRCIRCNGTGVVRRCNGCGVIGCDGNCTCTYCDGEKEISCENDDCDSGYLVDADGDMTATKCPTCKGRNRIRCPKC